MTESNDPPQPDTPQEPEAVASNADANQEQPKRGERRKFLVDLGKMTFLTAALTKVGVTPAHGQQNVQQDGQDVPPKEPVPACQTLDIDLNCNKANEKGEVTADTDCGKAKSNGDQDCGKWQVSGHIKHQDNDCVVSGGDGADADCGVQKFANTVWEDNDCSKGGQDQDCGLLGLSDDLKVYKHTDSDT